MAKLTTEERNALPDSTFALPGRHYPLDTVKRARNALARVSAFGNEREKTIVREKVRRKYPKIHVGEK